MGRREIAVELTDGGVATDINESQLGDAARQRKNFFQAIHQKIRIVHADAHRRLDAQHIAVQPPLPSSSPRSLASSSTAAVCCLGGLLGVPVFHQFYAQHQSHAAHVADQRMPLLKIDQAILQMRADA